MKSTHLPVTQAALVAVVTQIISFVAAFGLVSSQKEGFIIAAATAFVNAAFLIANALHNLAKALDK